MGENLSKKRRDLLLKTLLKIKEKEDDEETLKNLSLIENELTRKKYGLIWEEHQERVDEELEHNIPIFDDIEERTLKKDNSSKMNFLIEGDNLHSLYLLTKTHANKIKMIYIDPPYNRGSNDFIYDDKYINKEDEFKHSKWLSFMYRRLILAKKLMKKDGSVILISIDENECHNLKILCDEIFGEKNYIGDFIRKTKSSTNDADSFFNLQHDYCLIYKQGDFSFIGVDKDLDGYKNPDNDPNGRWKSSDPSAKSGGESTYFPIENPITGQVDYPPTGRYWAFSKSSLKTYIENGKIKFKDKIKKNERGFIFKSYVKQLKNNKKPVDSLFFADNEYMNQVATKEINNLGIEFDYPKPVSFLEKLILFSTTDKDIILDFFAGTGTTGQAVIEANCFDNQKRSFILCTNNENNICENAAYKRLKEYDGKINLKYYKTSYIPKIDNDENIIQDNLLSKIKNLIQLENELEIDNNLVRVFFTEEDFDEFTSILEEVKKCKKLYLSSDILLTLEQEQMINDNDIELFIIPEFYFEEEIKEAQ